MASKCFNLISGKLDSTCSPNVHILKDMQKTWQPLGKTRDYKLNDFS